MAIFAQLIGVCWLIFMAVWLTTALGAKRTVYRSYHNLILRIVLALCVVLVVSLSQYGIKARHVGLETLLTTNPTLGALGLVMTALGVAFAIWARVYLGRNWGMPMSEREDAELVTSGPYAYVRHPIYAGAILAMLGTGLGVGWPWFIFALAMLAYFVFSATQEEKLMLKLFPGEYPAYMARTKMLIPWLL